MLGNVIEARSVFKTYLRGAHQVAALRDASLTVARGELVTIMGPSGSGKSTLLRMLAGHDRPSAGTVRVFEHDLRTLRGRALADYRSRTLGYADQHYTRALAPELDARELVGLRLGLLGAPAPARMLAADRLLDRVGLLDKRHALPAEFSGGQLQRIAICAALAHGPRLFIADEPTGELDAANAAQIYVLIRELAAEAGVTTILVSHDPESAAVADRGITSIESTESVARGFMSRYGALFGLQDQSRELSVKHIKKSRDGRSFVRFQQRQQGLRQAVGHHAAHLVVVVVHQAAQVLVVQALGHADAHLAVRIVAQQQQVAAR